MLYILYQSYTIIDKNRGFKALIKIKLVSIAPSLFQEMALAQLKANQDLALSASNSKRLNLIVELILFVIVMFAMMVRSKKHNYLFDFKLKFLLKDFVLSKRGAVN